MAEHVIVRAVKEVDPYTSHALRDHLIAAIECGTARSVIVDLSATEFIDMSGLAVLVGALKRARRHDCAFALAAPTGWVMKALRITGLVKVFTILDEVPDG